MKASSTLKAETKHQPNQLSRNAFKNPSFARWLCCSSSKEANVLYVRGAFFSSSGRAIEQNLKL
jgi:hypothetical protein